MIDPLDRIDRRRQLPVEVVGQSGDLLDVEDRIGLQERDVALDLAAIAVGLRPGETACIDDGRT